MSNILITGAAGSLGKAFVKYLKDEHTVIGVDSNEWAVAEFQQEFPDVEIHLNDFNNWRFHQDPVDIIIHCAAYKHVNLGEENVHTFVENNVTKTGKLFAEAYKHNVDIIFISTDKAVEPISTYGFTKALGERLAAHYNGYIVRLGNILSSNGSVIPVWEKCIAEGKPIPITDINMKRYVIEVNDAVKQIWDSFLEGYKLIIPKCEEVSISDLFWKVTDKHKIKDIPIEIIGIRPGEKLQEKMRWSHE
jgi:FlaA1/EpsC-like NDP-sugar epimerase